MIYIGRWGGGNIVRQDNGYNGANHTATISKEGYMDKAEHYAYYFGYLSGLIVGAVYGILFF